MARKLDKSGGATVAIIKKYANRRLYNTQSSSYVTLDELSRMVREGREFQVFDAKSSEDITRSVLTQIIMEEDAKGRNLLPISFLRKVISFYDDSLHAVLPRYLEVSMENFARHQDQVRSYMEGTFGRFFPLPAQPSHNPLEDLTRQNVAMFQNAARMLNPFVDPASQPDDESEAPADRRQELVAEMEQLKQQMQQLQQRIERLNTDTDA